MFPKELCGFCLSLSSSLKTSLSGQPLRVMLGEMEELMKGALKDILGDEKTVSLFDLCHRVVFTSVVKVLGNTIS